MTRLYRQFLSVSSVLRKNKPTDLRGISHIVFLVLGLIAVIVLCAIGITSSDGIAMIIFSQIATPVITEIIDPVIAKITPHHHHDHPFSPAHKALLYIFVGIAGILTIWVGSVMMDKISENSIAIIIIIQVLIGLIVHSIDKFLRTPHHDHATHSANEHSEPHTHTSILSDFLHHIFSLRAMVLLYISAAIILIITLYGEYIMAGTHSGDYELKLALLAQIPITITTPLLAHSARYPNTIIQRACRILTLLCVFTATILWVQLLTFGIWAHSAETILISQTPLITLMPLLETLKNHTVAHYFHQIHPYLELSHTLLGYTIAQQLIYHGIQNRIISIIIPGVILAIYHQHSQKQYFHHLATGAQLILIIYVSYLITYSVYHLIAVDVEEFYPDNWQIIGVITLQNLIILIQWINFFALRTHYAHPPRILSYFNRKHLVRAGLYICIITAITFTDILYPHITDGLTPEEIEAKMDDLHLISVLNTEKRALVYQPENNPDTFRPCAIPSPNLGASIPYNGIIPWNPATKTPLTYHHFLHGCSYISTAGHKRAIFFSNTLPAHIHSYHEIARYYHLKPLALQGELAYSLPNLHNANCLTTKITATHWSGILIIDPQKTSITWRNIKICSSLMMYMQDF